MGYLYRPKLKNGKPARIWWVKYYVNGNPIRESTGTEREIEAKRFLKVREGRVAMGQPVLRRMDRIRYEEAAEDLRKHYRTTGRRSPREAEIRLKHLDRFFRHARLASIDHATTTRYVETRQQAGAGNATVNRELGILGRMFRLAYEGDKLFRVPSIKDRSSGNMGKVRPSRFLVVPGSSRTTPPRKSTCAQARSKTSLGTRQPVMWANVTTA